MDEFDDEGDSLLLNVTAESFDTGIGSKATKSDEVNEFDDDYDGDLIASLDKSLTAVKATKSDEVNEFDDDYDGDLIASLDKSLTTIKDKPDVDPPVNIPDEFPFPFEPYDIQKGFMRELYRSLELGKVGIFESPTGTGKSLSLICGALRWLKNYQEKQKLELEMLLAERDGPGVKSKESLQENKNDELDWISEFKVKQEVEEENKKKREEIEQVLKREKKLTKIRTTKPISKRKRVHLEDEFDNLMEGASSDVKNAAEAELKELETEDASLNTDHDDHLVLADYDSDDAGTKNDGEDDDEDAVHCTKIYFCSRTHSQLSQFVREVIKSPYGDDTRVISLGSRQNLCVNEAVKKLKSISLINDTCRDLLKKKADKSTKTGEKRQRIATSKGCPYYKQDPILDFKDQSLVEVRDIEQLVVLGKHMKACPYYGTRLAIPDAEIVALPYNTLLHKSTREASGIQLKDNIVVIDEAHNLLETINSVYSVEVTGAQIVRAHCQLRQYEQKYRSRLKAQNLMYIKQILFILSNLTKCVGGKTEEPPEKQTNHMTETKLWTINDFLFHCQLDNVNMFRIIRYCEKSQISRKLLGFVEKYHSEIVWNDKEKKEETSRSGLSSFLKSISNKENIDTQETKPSEHQNSSQEVILKSPMMHIEGFLLALTNADKDGRIVVNRQGLISQSSIKFLLLNPAIYFKEIVQESRAVIVAGGTMQPISEFKDQLFHAAGVESSQILEYSCGHVIPADQLLPIAMTTGPTGTQLDFTYQNRTNPKLLDELGRLVCNICNVVPGGVICFFPSYDYEKLVFTYWEKNGVIQKIENKKKIFREPKRAGQVDFVLQQFSSCIQNCKGSLNGSLLLCVVGGKMSEGINFSDDLGRCVMMVGMPYPNINSPELKEKMDYLNANFPKDPEGKLPGQVHYENLCMKAVNQSIEIQELQRSEFTIFCQPPIEMPEEPFVIEVITPVFCYLIEDIQGFLQSTNCQAGFLNTCRKLTSLELCLLLFLSSSVIKGNLLRTDLQTLVLTKLNSLYEDKGLNTNRRQNQILRWNISLAVT